MTIEDVQAEIQELKDNGFSTNDSIVRELYRQHPDIKGEEVSQIAKVLNISVFDVGRIKSAIARSEKGGKKNTDTSADTTGQGKGGGFAEWLDNLPPIARTFYDSMMQVYGKTPEKARSITNIFVKNIGYLQTRQNFHTWLSRYLLPQDVESRIEDEMFGLDVFNNSGGQPGMGGQPQIQYMQQPGGGVMPVIIMPNQQQPQNMMWPGMWNMPQSKEKERDPEIDELKEGLKNVTQAVGDLTILMTTKNQNPPPVTNQPAYKVRRRPMMDDAGNLRRDAEGTVLYEEIPYDEAEAQIERLKLLNNMNRKEGGELTEDNVRNLFNEELTKRETRQSELSQMESRIMAQLDERFPKNKDQHTESPEVIKLREQVNTLMEEKKVSNEVSQAIEKRIAPLMDEMSILKGLAQKNTLTGDGALYAHREAMASQWQNFFQGAGTMLDRNVRLGLMQMIIPQLRQAGIPDELIGDVVRSANATGPGAPASGSTTGSLRERAKDFDSKYLKR